MPVVPAARHEGDAMSPTIERAHREDLASVLDLLDRHGLPLDGAGGLGDTLVVARLNGEVVGAAGLELYADGALLRSVVVDARAQGQGLGHRLTEAALTLARDRGASVVFLLTTTAAQFFPRFGFEQITRDDVPESVRQSVEFQSACPASAVVMRHRMGSVQ
jgi:amino-acid N-acetyltransferase